MGVAKDLKTVQIMTINNSVKFQYGLLIPMHSANTSEAIEDPLREN